MVDAAQLQLKLSMRDGRMIRSLADAIALVREHESRPGVDVRDEVLHLLERARTDQERQAAAAAFIAWAEELNLLLPPTAAAQRAITSNCDGWAMTRSK